MEMSVGALSAQIIKIQEVMSMAMKEGIHYGVIPGTDKPTLLKAGAEKLAFVFRLAPSFDIKREDLPGNHREFTIVCTLTHIPTGKIMGQGVGSCSTMEKKYRYRLGDAEKTDKQVPQSYWTLRKTDANKAQELLGGKGFVTKKIDNVWWICKKSEDHTENPDLADTYNTVLKMAKKRAQVDATLTATACSDCFNQDLDEIEGFAEKMRKPEDEAPAEPKAEAKAEKPAAPRQMPPQFANVFTVRSEQQQDLGFSYKQSLWDALKAYAGDNRKAGDLCKELTGKAFFTALTEDEAKEGLKKFQEQFQQTPLEDAQVG